MIYPNMADLLSDEETSEGMWACFMKDNVLYIGCMNEDEKFVELWVEGEFGTSRNCTGTVHVMPRAELYCPHIRLLTDKEEELVDNFRNF